MVGVIRRTADVIPRISQVPCPPRSDTTRTDAHREACACGGVEVLRSRCSPATSARAWSSLHGRRPFGDRARDTHYLTSAAVLHRDVPLRDTHSGESRDTHSRTSAAVRAPKWMSHAQLDVPANCVRPGGCPSEGAAGGCPSEGAGGCPRELLERAQEDGDRLAMGDPCTNSCGATRPRLQSCSRGCS